jgi:EpsI family protein
MRFIKSASGRLLIAAALVALPQAAIWRLEERARVDAAEAAKLDVRDLPMSLGRWTGTPAKLDPHIFAKIGAASEVDRLYKNGVGTQVAVHVASFSDANARPHHPQECYPDAGFAILEDNWRDDGQGRRYRWLIAEQSRSLHGVCYWFQLGPEVVSTRDELRHVLQRLRREGRPWPGVVKVMIQVPIAFSADNARRTAEELAAPVYDWIRDHASGRSA